MLALQELKVWQYKMLWKPSFFNNLSKKMQIKVNSWIPEKVHRAIAVSRNTGITWTLPRWPK
jgi:hypothetical protein